MERAIRSLRTIQWLALTPALKAAAAAFLTIYGPAAVSHLTHAPRTLSMVNHLANLGPWAIAFFTCHALAQSIIPAFAIRDIRRTGEVRPWVAKTSHLFVALEKSVQAIFMAPVTFFRWVRWRCLGCPSPVTLKHVGLAPAPILEP